MKRRRFREKLRYRFDELMGGGAARQLLLLFALTLALVAIFTGLGLASGVAGDMPADDLAWFYFTRVLDPGTMGGDEGDINRFVSTAATVLGVIVAGLLISSLAGNFQERLEGIRRSGSSVIEEGHFLILGWSEKIHSVVDQLSVAYEERGRIVVVVMADRDKLEMEERLREKVTRIDKIKLVVRSGSPRDMGDLDRVSFDQAEAVILLIEDDDAETPERADGRMIKTLLAIYNHPRAKGRADEIRVTAEVMLAESMDIAAIASGGRAHVVRTNDMISKILLQTSRITGLSIVYDELLRFEGDEIYFSKHDIVGERFGDLLLDFPAALVVGVANAEGFVLNPPADRMIEAGDELLMLAEDKNIVHLPYNGPLRLDDAKVPPPPSEKPVEQLLVLGWNEKVFPIVDELDAYVGPGSKVTFVNTLPEEDRARAIAEKCAPQKNVTVEHVSGDFTSRSVLERVEAARYPTVMVLGDMSDGRGTEASDTRAIIALLLLRDLRTKAGVKEQEVCSEILDPRNRELAATTEINDIVISNEMVSMVLAQVTHEPRIKPVLEDFFDAEGNEVYLKDLALYAPLGEPTTFERLVLAAKARGEVAMGLQIYVDDPSKRYGITLNPKDDARRGTITPKARDRLIVLAEDDG